MRELSTPEKVFEYFASQGDPRSGFSMTASDAMRSVVAVFPPFESDILRGGSLPGEPSPRVPQHPSAFFNAFDVDGSGGITFDEWLLFESLLSIPEDDVEVAFALMDQDGNGSVDVEEFHQVLMAIQSRASKAPSHATHQRKTSVSLASSKGGLVTLFFGADGSKKLTPVVFKTFLSDFREGMMELEFKWYDFRNKGSIAARDFALSVVGCARLKHIDEYLDQIEAMPKEIAEKQVTYEDFKAFRSVWRRLRQLAVALEFWRHSSGRDFSPAELISVVDRVMKVKLPPQIVDVLFYLFSGEEGCLNTHYMLRVMDRHFEAGLGQAMENGAMGGGGGGGEGQRGLFECLSKCTKKQS